MKGSLAALIIAHFGRALSEEELRAQINTRASRSNSDICTLLQRAIVADNTLVAEVLLRDYGADPNLCDESGYPPLIYGHGRAVQLLFHYGANINLGWETYGHITCTPLHYAWKWSQTYFVDLLDLGAHYRNVIPATQYAMTAAFVEGSQRERNARHLRAVIAREQSAQLACFALLLLRVAPRDVLRALARALWSTRRREGWENE